MKSPGSGAKIATREDFIWSSTREDALSGRHASGAANGWVGPWRCGLEGGGVTLGVYRWGVGLWS